MHTKSISELIKLANDTEITEKDILLLNNRLDKFELECELEAKKREYKE